MTMYAFFDGRCRRLHCALAAGLVLLASPVAAHHSYAAFDSAHTRTLKGTVTFIQWGNPHAEFKLSVEPDGGGKRQEWSIETHAPNILLRYGWTKDTLKYGDRVSVVCNAMLDGSHGCRLHTVTFLDSGKTLETKLSVSLKSQSEQTPIPSTHETNSNK